MKKSLFAAALLLAASIPAYAVDVPELKADFQEFGVLPEGVYMGEAMGVAINSKGHVFVFSRSNTSGDIFRSIAAQLFEFDHEGKFVREIGRNLYGFGFAHTVRVDKDDNIWTTDKGTDMVVKFGPDGRVKMVFGRKQEAADFPTGPIERVTPPRAPSPAGFRQVTDVAWDPEGNTYVSDGYINSRIAKFDTDGNYVTSFGEPGSGPGQLNTPHTIAGDAKGLIYVGDRGNGHIQVFDRDGKLVRIMTGANDVSLPKVFHPIRQPPPPGAVVTNHTVSPGSPWGICITPANAKGEQFLYTADSYPGRIYKMTLEGKVLGTIGTGGRTIGHFGDVHSIACESENVIYAAEELNWRVQKITIHP